MLFLSIETEHVLVAIYDNFTYLKEIMIMSATFAVGAPIGIPDEACLHSLSFLALLLFCLLQLEFNDPIQHSLFY